MAFGASIGSKRTEIQFFPENVPKQIMVYIEYPEGTDIEKTNEITKAIENKVYQIINQDKYIRKDGVNILVESAVSQVGEGAGNPYTDGGSASKMPNRGKITATMREFKFRENDEGEILNSEVLRKEIQEALQGVYPGVAISVEKDPVGPPAGYPVNIEIQGEDYNALIDLAELMRDYLNGQRIAGVDQLKIDVNRGKPVMEVIVDREKAGELGVSAGQVGQQLAKFFIWSKSWCLQGKWRRL